MKLDKIYPIVIGFFIVATVLFAVLVPFRQKRLQAQDNITVAALKEVSTTVKAYANKQNKLPSDLKDIDFKAAENKYNSPGLAKDEAPLKIIEYKKVSDKQFQLCGDFKTRTDDKKSLPTAIDSPVSASSLNNSSSMYNYSTLYSSVSYTAHPAGKHCFDKETVYVSSNSYYDTLNSTSNSLPSGGSTASSSATATARDAARRADINQLAMLAEEYYAENGKYPTDCTTLTTGSTTKFVAPNASSKTVSSCSTTTPTASVDVYSYKTGDSGKSFTLKYWSETSKSLQTKNSLSN